MWDELGIVVSVATGEMIVATKLQASVEGRGTGWLRGPSKSPGVKALLCPLLCKLEQEISLYFSFLISKMKMIIIPIY